MDACQRTMEHLTASGILTYKPGVATDKCRAPYVVVRGGGAYARGMSGAAGIGYRTVTLYCFVPRVSGDLSAFVAEVRRIMREGAMRPVYLKRPKRWSSYAGEIGEAPANLVERDFHADAPNMLWVTDVTQFTMDGYKCWLSPVVDCFDGMVVSWTLSRSPNADMANRMLLDAVATLRDGEHPIIHSD